MRDVGRAPDARGLLVAAAVIGAWAASLVGLLLVPLEPSSEAPAAAALWVAPAVLLRTWLSTGLFITAHDAMHGTVHPDRRINDAVGRLAVTLYALFPYRKLVRLHHAHHRHVGEPGADPDFHDGRGRDPVRWYLGFVRRYVGWGQLVGMALVFNVLHHGAGVVQANLLLFWVVPALLSTVQLFVVGTWLPHREPHTPGDPHRARTLDLPRPLSLLACFHFGYHREHHEAPWVPWWRLRPARELAALRPRDGAV